MRRLGFIHDMMDVKVLILFVMARVSYPVNIQQIYELCYQDECLSYFDVCTAVPEMVKSGHLKEAENEMYIITEKGKADGSLTEDSIAYTVKQRAENAVARFNRQSGSFPALLGDLIAISLQLGHMAGSHHFGDSGANIEITQALVLIAQFINFLAGHRVAAPGGHEKDQNLHIQHIVNKTKSLHSCFSFVSMVLL